MDPALLWGSSARAGQAGTPVLAEPLSSRLLLLSRVLRRWEVGSSWVWESGSGCAVDQALKTLLRGIDSLGRGRLGGIRLAEQSKEEVGYQSQGGAIT